MVRSEKLTTQCRSKCGGWGNNIIFYIIMFAYKDILIEYVIHIRLWQKFMFKVQVVKGVGNKLFEENE